MYIQSTFYGSARVEGLHAYRAEKYSCSGAKKIDVSSTIDGRDIGRFEKLSQSASEWMDEQKGGFRALHSFNRLRVPWIASNLSKESCTHTPLKGLRLVDVGCGGGLLSMSCVVLELNRLQYVASSVEAFSETNADGFDGVIASEIVEHVNDLQSFLHHCVKLDSNEQNVCHLVGRECAVNCSSRSPRLGEIRRARDAEKLATR
uniref:Uncharacterized protein n=1 Tax=Ditylenchus dipsaci TaxID=166011 RepID=A0A915E250_9BILA